jgi:addiction module RelB/DinJ family antitoxin
MSVKTNNKTVSVQVRIKEDLKKRAEEVLEKLDLNMSDAFRLFLSDVARNKRIPISLSLVGNVYNDNQQLAEALDYFSKNGSKFGDEFLSKRGLKREDLSEDNLYDLIKKTTSKASKVEKK